MGHITKTPAGTYRANWRDVAGKQKAKNFRTKKEASGFLAQVESALHRGVYVDPHAGRQLFGPYAEKWLAARTTQATTRARDASVMNVHVLPKWESVPIGRIDHLAVQGWIGDLAKDRAPATVAVCLRFLRNILDSACRDRIIAVNPTDGVKAPRLRRNDVDGNTIGPNVLTTQLLPVIPDRYRAVAAVAGGAGLRWGECIGLRWDCVDLAANELHIIRVAVEVAGTVSMKPFPKSRAGRRTVPIPGFVRDALTQHRELFTAGPGNEVFRNSAGGPLRRTLFRSRIWRPAIVRAGLLGNIVPAAGGRFAATWPTVSGTEETAIFGTETEAIRQVARLAHGGLRFHDLRHSYATWLISRGVPVNDVQRAMGHERASTTLDLYTHPSKSGDDTIRTAFADDSLTREAEEIPSRTDRTDPE